MPRLLEKGYPIYDINESCSFFKLYLNAFDLSDIKLKIVYRTLIFNISNKFEGKIYFHHLANENLIDNSFIDGTLTLIKYIQIK